MDQVCLLPAGLHAAVTPQQAGVSVSEGSAHLGNPEGHPVLLAQLFQLRHDTVGDAGRALGIQAVQHPLHQVNLCSSTSGWRERRCVDGTACEEDDSSG